MNFQSLAVALDLEIQSEDVVLLFKGFNQDIFCFVSAVICT